jgi:tRNA dimethylallyltransferase
MSSKRPLLVVVGPTASGKTAFAVELAERFGGEVLSADSVQVYREFDIGSGKPSAAELARVPHHLVGFRDPLEPLEAASWAELADARLQEVRSRGKIPIVCGGTFLWIRALVYGLAAAPPGNPEIRARHAEWAAREGRDALHRALAVRDPEIAKRLAPNDFVRVSRALEVLELTGMPLSAWQAQHGFRERRHDACLVGVNLTRDELDARIATRVRRMFEEGFIEEVRSLLARGRGEARAMKSVGYRQIAEALASPRVAPEADLEAAVVRATRVFVRRQRTWLRDEPVTYLEPGGELPSSVREALA